MDNNCDVKVLIDKHNGVPIYACVTSQEFNQMVQANVEKDKADYKALGAVVISILVGLLILGMVIDIYNRKKARYNKTQS